ncbi:hypothetical protein PAPYR_5022 [Paratrimastix pyriformis]|uniref:F-box domain-containing protein n=1 Tax=Paratrimastix pyriformis TaxID=342808 RepID=A0ABQ8UKM2_9EUKA|nr:hypothetical protein PAPYR_5022 [Paratrimastix pyriformis]
MILLDLPSDLLVEILRQLPLLDTVAPCSTCRHLSNLASGALTNYPLAEIYETDWKQKRISLMVMRRIVALKIRGNKGSYPAHWLTRLAPYSSHLRVLDVRESASFNAAMADTPALPVPAAVFPTVTTLYASGPFLRGTFFMGVDITFPGLVVLHMGHTTRCLPPDGDESCRQSPAPVEPRFVQLRWVFWSCRPDPLPVRFPAGCHFVNEMIEVGLVAGTAGLEEVLAAGHLASRVNNPLWAAVANGRWDLFDFLTAPTAPDTLLARPGYLREAAPPRLRFPLYSIDTCFAKPHPGSTLAVCCALTDRVDLMQKLVDRGADPFAADLSRYDGPSAVREVARRIARKVAPPKVREWAVGVRKTARHLHIHGFLSFPPAVQLVAWYEALMQTPVLEATSHQRERGKELVRILWDVSPKDPILRRAQELLEEGRLAARCPALAQGMLEGAILALRSQCAALLDLLLQHTDPSPECFVVGVASYKTENYEKLRAAHLAARGPDAMRELYADRTVCYDILHALVSPRWIWSPTHIDRLIADGADPMLSPPPGRPRLLAVVGGSESLVEQLFEAGHVPEQGDVDAQHEQPAIISLLLRRGDECGIRLRVPQGPDWAYHSRRSSAKDLRYFMSHGLEVTPSFVLTLIRTYTSRYHPTDQDELPELLRFALRQVAPAAWQPLLAPAAPTTTGRGSLIQLAPALRALRETLAAWRANPAPDRLRTLSEALDLLPEREPLVSRCVHYGLPSKRRPCPGIEMTHVLLVLVVRKWQTCRGLKHPAARNCIAARQRWDPTMRVFLERLCEVARLSPSVGYRASS